METQMPDVPMMHILSYLDAFTLLQVSQVNKAWNMIAGSDRLWRKLCLKKWNFCSFLSQLVGAQTWKQFFLKQTRQEYQMAMAEPKDFIYKEISGHFGTVYQVSYLSGNGLTMEEQNKSIICIVSSWPKISTWDVHKGTMIWSCKGQEDSIHHLETFPQMHLAITEDVGTILKVWNCRDAGALSARKMHNYSCSMAAFLTKYGPFLVVGDLEGSITTLTVPDLEMLCIVDAFGSRICHLLCSPEKKWILAYGTDEHTFPKVFFMDSILRPSEYDSPLCLSFPFASCWGACWTPRRENRITLMHRIRSKNVTVFITFELTTTEIPWGRKNIKEQQIANFVLPNQIQRSPKWMDVSHGNVIAFESGPYIFLFTIYGHLLHRFEDNPFDIENIWVYPLKDSPHVVATLKGGSLHMYMWDERNCPPYFRSCCRLEYYEEPLTEECNFSKTMCDNKSVVCVQSAFGQSSVLRMYTLNV